MLGGGGGRGLDSDLRQALSGLPRSPPSAAAAAAAAEDEAARDARLAVFQAVPPFPVFVRSPLSGSSPLPSRSPMVIVGSTRVVGEGFSRHVILKRPKSGISVSLVSRVISSPKSAVGHGPQSLTPAAFLLLGSQSVHCVCSRPLPVLGNPSHRNPELREGGRTP